ncbi:hypothetical protein B7494_g5858 [Chlorociboria aeruginascens]|nr:hypothetical protein B7494_g5858 [Chlorociboria aeruginascens]
MSEQLASPPLPPANRQGTSFSTSATLVGSPTGDIESWDKTYKSAVRSLADEDKDWFSKPEHQEPFTSAQMIAAIEPHAKRYTKHMFQRFLSVLDPILSHIGSFAEAISIMVQADPTCAGLIWGGLYLVIQLAGRTQRTLDLILDSLWNISPDLALFQKWMRLFPEKDYKELSDAIRKVYAEVIAFCKSAQKYLRRHPAANLVRTLFVPKVEAAFKMHENQIKAYTARVKAEVDSAHMHSVHSRLQNIENLMEAFPKASNFVASDGIRMIPHSRNNRFFGRTSILEKIEESLKPNKENRQRCIALYGLGGSGKTQIALEYTYSHLQEYHSIIWILADNKEKIDQGFREAAEQFGMKRTAQNVNQEKDFVLQQLASRRDEYLLVFDNADNISLVQDCFPRANHGAIILTTRDSVMSAEVATSGQAVLEFSIEEGRDFLNYSLPSQVTANAQDIAWNISATFHGFALALGQIAGYIRTSGCSLQDFVRMYENRKNTTALTALPVKDYHSNLATVWDLSLSTLSSEAKTILEILTFVDPDSVPNALFQEPTAEGSDAWPQLDFLADPIKFWESLKMLRSQSLIRTNTELNTISIHRYFRDNIALRLQKDPARRRAAFQQTLHLLTNIQPEFLNHNIHWSPDNWTGSEQYLPHIKALEVRFLEEPSAFRDSENKLAKLIYHCAVYEFERNHYKSAEETMATARFILNLAKDPNILLLSDCYRIEGRLFNESNQPLRTLESSRNAKHYAEMAVAQNLIDVNDSRMPRILTGWGNALNQLGRFQEALDLQLEALKLCRTVPRDKSDAIIIVQLNWAYLLLRVGDLDRAERILKETVVADPQAAYVIYPLGNVYLAQGKIDQGLAEHYTALKIYMGWFGEQHALIADSLYKIGEILLLHKNDAKQAAPLLQKALDIYHSQGLFYDTRQLRARCSRTLAKALEQLGSLDEAEEYYEMAFHLRHEFSGIMGSKSDSDEDYVKPLFYWAH